MKTLDGNISDLEEEGYIAFALSSGSVRVTDGLSAQYLEKGWS